MAWKLELLAVAVELNGEAVGVEFMKPGVTFLFSAGGVPAHLTGHPPAEKETERLRYSMPVSESGSGRGARFRVGFGIGIGYRLGIGCGIRFR